MDMQKANPYWSEIERYHVFSRDRLIALLSVAVSKWPIFAIPAAPSAQMELYGIRK